MDTTTLLIIIVVLLLLGGGWYGRGRGTSQRSVFWRIVMMRPSRSFTASSKSARASR
jgi:hypothetical protein